MKNSLLLIAAVSLIGGSLAWGIEPIAVENASFELPGLGDYTGWDGELPGTMDVNGWTSDGMAWGSGVESGWGATEGTWSALLMSGDPSVWQVTDHVIAVDETLRLQVDAQKAWGAMVFEMGLFAYDELVDPNDPNIVTPIRIPLCTEAVDLAYEPQTFTLECNTAGTGLAGYRLGIELNNVSADLTWIGVDNVRLSTIVPTGVNIIWVTETVDRDRDGVQDDWGWIDWLLDEGHTVDVRPSYWTTFDPVDPNDANEVPKIDQLNAADLVIVSRAANSGNYDDGDEPAMWNSVKTPVLLLNAYLARNNRWRWVNTGAIANDMPWPEILDLDHPILDGVTVEQLNIVDPNDLIDPNDPNAPIVLPDPIYGVDALDPTVGSGLSTFIVGLDMGNGALIAKTYDANLGAIAEWQSGIEYYDGANQVSGDHRMLFCAGTQEVGPTPQGAWNLTAEGVKMFRNAIAHLLAQPLMAREPHPSPGATGVVLNGVVSWRAGNLATMYAIYVSANRNDVLNGTALVGVVEGTEFNFTPLGLRLGTTYYWRVDATDGFQTWPGQVQSFTTVDYLVADDFESYSANSIGNVWKDAWRMGSGAQNPGSTTPALSTDVVHSGGQSMMLDYDNSKNPFHGGGARTFSRHFIPATAGATTLVIYFHGDPGNLPEKLWVKIRGRKVVYNGGGLTKGEWTQWNIPLNLPGLEFRVPTSFYIGIGDGPAPSGGPGVVYIDDMRLYRVAP